ncbi:translation initiation factor IF-2 N-terminal domain-containing protein [Corynebacterium dentalis]|uniref:translation initiation factor IF-2 N-terminal domain-containing protein n=1 Tax=Corynebacterium dentalis TaxID=2014528 RepID=UPI00289FF28B|nr:translation initiation factor IF-2 N-terminal domain-containing protein [Corynebacterium dentalis]
MANRAQKLAAQAAQINRTELGEKTRVHALAKMLGVSSNEMLSVLTSQGISDKRAASTVTKQQVETVLDSLASDKNDEPKTAAKKTAKKAAKKTVKKTTKKTAKKSATKTTKKSTKKTAKKAETKTSAESDVKVVEEPAVQGEQALESVSAEQLADGGATGEFVAVAEPAAEVAPQVAQAHTESADEAKSEAEPEAENDPSDATVDQIIAPLFNNDGDADSSESVQKPKRRVRRVRRVVRRVGVDAGTAADGSQPEKSDSAQTESDSAQSEDIQPGKSDAQNSDANETTPEKKGRGNNRNRRRAKNNRRDDQTEDRNEDRADDQQGDSTEDNADQDPSDLHPAERDEADIVDEPVRFKGSTRLESRRRWKQENRKESRHVVSRSEFLARRESVDRVMVVRDSQRTDHEGLTTQVGVVEDGMLVEHFVTSETQHSMVGNVYLGTVQNVLASMEAAFIDLGTGRNAVLYSGEMNWHSPHLHSKNRRIDSALRPGDQIMVQVIKDPVGHKGARLTARVSFAGRYLVYFPGGTTAGISRKLPEAERKRLKGILSRVIPGEGGAIIRTAAENASEENIGEDVNRLHSAWENVLEQENKARSSKGSQPVTLYEEPNMLIKVIRDILNPDFSQLIVDGDKSWATVRDYVSRMAPDLKDRVVKWHPEQHADQDVFAGMELDEQLSKALSRKVWLPSGGHLVIDHTEAMTVVDVNTGSFIGSGGNLEETVTQNNLEAAEEIVRQMRLRDLGGMIVVDFIDMVLEENQDLVLRRLTEFLGRDRTRHKVSEVTSLGLVQMTRKRLGIGLLETFSTVCEHCGGRGVIVHADPVEHEEEEDTRLRRDHGHRKERQQAKREKQRREEHKEERKETRKDDRKAPNKAEQKSESKPERKSERNHGKRDAEQPNKRAEESREHKQPREENKANGRGGSGSGATATQRRRVRRVVRRHAPADHQTSPDQTAGGKQKDSGRGKSAQDAKQGSSSSRSASHRATSSADRVAAQRSESKRTKRRVRRVVRSAAPTIQQDQVQQDQAQRDRGQRNPQRRSAETRQSFAEAKAEFDSSPRRKRNTRGNSRSDIPPRPEDFQQQADAPKDDARKDSALKDTAQKPKEAKVASNKKRGRGRRVVRRSN